MRGFEFILDEQGNKAYPEARIPEYSTMKSAGADFFCAEDTVVQGIRNLVLAGKEIRPVLIHTGIKACMEDDEVLEIYNRSGNPKRGLVLANGVGVIDADYWDINGEIMFAFYNLSQDDVLVKAGDRIGQGVFKKVLKPDHNLVIRQEMRNGGFGSTGI